MAAGLGHVIAAVGTNFAGQGELGLVALHPDTGAISWMYQLDDPDVPAYNTLVSLVECATHGKVAVFASSTGTVYALELATGKLLWSAKGPQPAGFSTGGAIVGPDSTVYVATSIAGEGEEFVDAFLSSQTTSHEGVVSAHVLSNGTLKWRVNLGRGNEANSAPSIGSLSSDSSSLAVIVAVGINPSNADSSKPADGTSGPPRPAYTIALDATSGSLLWNYTMPLWHGAAAGDSPTHGCVPDSSGNVAIDGAGVVYVPHEDGAVYAIRDADGDGAIDNGEVHRFDLETGFQGAPAIAPGMLVVVPCDGAAAWIEDSEAGPL